MASQLNEAPVQVVQIEVHKLKSIIEELVYAHCKKAITQHIEAIIETAKDEATKAIAKRLLELVVKEQLETK